MICMLDSFIIDIKDMESFQKTISLPFVSQKRVANNPKHQSVEEFSEFFNFEATYYNKNSFYTKAVEQRIKMKKPVWLVFSNGEAFRVVVSNMEVVKSYFGKGGSTPLKQDVKFTIEVYYE